MRFQLRPPVRERLRLGDQAGMSRCLLRVSIDDSADRGRISEPVPETDSNEAFEIRRREAPPLAAGSLALEDEMARSVAISVVPEPQKASSSRGSRPRPAPPA